MQKLTEELQQRSQNIEELKGTSEQVTANISQHDRELVEDHIRYVDCCWYILLRLLLVYIAEIVVGIYC